MNLGAIQALTGSLQQHSVAQHQSSQGVTSSFGAILKLSEQQAKISPQQSLEVSVTDDLAHLTEQLLTIQTPEELVSLLEQMDEGLKPLEVDETSLMTALASPTTTVEDFARMLGMNPQSMMDTIQSLLQQAGLPVAEAQQLNGSTSIWTVLQKVDQVSISMRELLVQPLDQESTVSKQQALQLITFLKAVEVVAPKVDLHVKMEHQIFTIKELLSHVSGQITRPTTTVQNQSHDLSTLITTARNTVQGAGKTTVEQNFSQSQRPHETNFTSQMTTVTVPNNLVTATESLPESQANRLLHELQLAMKRSNFGQVGGSNRMLIKLYPEHLGTLRIELVEHKGVMNARILASTAVAREMLDSQLHQLRQAFHQQNIQIDRIDITQSLQDASKHQREHAFHQQHRSPQDQTTQNEHQRKQEEEKTFDEYLIELEV